MTNQMTIDVSEAMVVLSTMLERYRNVTPLLEEIGQLETEAAKERIRSGKVTPYGAEWEPWADSTAAYRHRKGNAGQGLLWDTGTLLDDMQYHVDGYTVEIGSPLSYSVFLQYGTYHMPARKFLGWGDNQVFYEDMATAFFGV